LRADFVPEDLVLGLMANAGLVRSAAAARGAPPPSAEGVRRAMRQRGESLGYS
jgi:hypothetical protein